jgi:hypothetical protein
VISTYFYPLFFKIKISATAATAAIPIVIPGDKLQPLDVAAAAG